MADGYHSNGQRLMPITIQVINPSFYFLVIALHTHRLDQMEDLVQDLHWHAKMLDNHM